MLIIPGESKIVPVQAELSVSIESRPVVLSSSSTSNATVRDANFVDSTTSTVRLDSQIFAARSPSSGFIQFDSLNEAVATVDQEGYVTSGTDVVAATNILVKTPSLVKRIYHYSETTGGQTTRTFIDYVSGSLGDILNQEIDQIISEGGSLNVYNTIDNITPSYQRNSSCWIDADLTCWPVWSSSRGNKFNGCLISPCHLVVAKHANPGTGATIRFVTANNQIVERTTGSGIDVGSFDLRILKLTADVPNSISFAKVFPQDWPDYLTFGAVPLLACNQFGEIFLRDGTTANTISNPLTCAHKISTVLSRLAYTKSVISGDSGSPLFALINGELIVIGTHYTAVGLPFITQYFSDVNAAMTSLGGGYQLTEFDLSEYTNYG